MKVESYTDILKSDSHQSFYYGHCEYLDKRPDQHNKGKVRFTKGRKPWKLHYFEVFETRSKADKRERYFKTIEGYKYLKENNII